MKNIVYLDTKSKRIKTTTYAKFDEAHFSCENRPPGAQILINLGLKSNLHTNDPSETPPTLQIVKRHPKAIIPRQGLAKAAGYDLHSITDCVIPPNSVSIIDTGIAAKFPNNTYGCIASQSGLTIHNNVETQGGVIDPDYVGTIKIILHNFGTTDFHVKQSDRVTQLILEQYLSPHIQVATKLQPTGRNDKDFGSTGVSPSPRHTESVTHKIPYDTDKIPHHTIVNKEEADATLHSATLEMVFTKPVNTTTVQIQGVAVNQ